MAILSAAVSFLALQLCATSSVLGAPLVNTSASTPAAASKATTAWPQLRSGLTWANKAWCESGVDCWKDPDQQAAVVFINGYYQLDTVRDFQAQGKAVVCYFSAGVLNKQLDKQYSVLPKGGKVSPSYPDLWWMDITKQDPVRKFMGGRLDKAKSAGCDALELDNIDCWENPGCYNSIKQNPSTVKTITIGYLKWLSDESHKRGMALGMKNSVALIPDVHKFMDFSINENCYKYNECGTLKPFQSANKAIFGTNTLIDFKTACSVAKQNGIVLKNDVRGNAKGWRSC